MPEQKLSTNLSPGHSDPQLRAAGARVFGAWGGGDAAPQSGINYGYSLDGGATWTGEASLPIALPPNYPASLPLALDLTATSVVHLLVDNLGHFYYRRPTIDAPLWTAPVLCGYEGGDYWERDDLPCIAADPLAHTVNAAFARHPTSPYESTIWFIRSLDDGVTWSAHADISNPNCNGSSMVIGPDGTLYVTWVDYSLGQVVLRKSTDHGVTFSPPVAVAGMLDNLNAWVVGWWVRGSVGTRYYPYYRSGVSTAAAPNFPTLAVDTSNGPTRGWLYLTWADQAAGTPAPATTTVYDTEPNDNPQDPLGDASLAQLVPLDCDIVGSVTASEYGSYDADWYAFNGTVGETIHLDGPVSSARAHGAGLFEQLPDGGRLLLGFASIPGSDDVAAGAHSKPLVFTLPHTGRYLLRVGAGEPWGYTLRLRHYLVAPTSLARDMRDIVLVRSTDGGATWSPKVRVNHDPAGADQHQPNVAVDGQGRVYVAWYDRRGSVLGNTAHAYASVSTDGGMTFGPDLQLSSVPSAWTQPTSDPFPDYSLPGGFIGDRIALAAGTDFGMAAWTDLRNWPAGPDVYGARIVDIPTAVNAVSDLAAEPLADGVRLRWRVNDARGIASMAVMRSDESTPEAVLGRVPNTGIEGELEYLDATAGPGRRYDYRLAVRVEGTTQYLGPVTIETPTRIDALAWRTAGPNPFDRQTAVALAIPRSEAGVVRVYDIQGKVVRTLREGRFEAGVQRLEWDGRDAAGADSPPGLYFVAAQVGTESARTKLTRIR
jgi:hypothetical protein